MKFPHNNKTQLYDTFFQLNFDFHLNEAQVQVERKILFKF